VRFGSQLQAAVAEDRQARPVAVGEARRALAAGLLRGTRRGERAADVGAGERDRAGRAYGRLGRRHAQVRHGGAADVHDWPSRATLANSTLS